MNALERAGPGGASHLAEMALRVADHVPAMLAYWSSDQICLFANEAYREWFGKSRLEVVGSTMRDLLGPLYELNLPYIRRVLAGEAQVFERTIPQPNGGIRESLATYVPDIVDGVVQGFFVHVADVTAMKALERELAKARRAAEQAANHLHTVLQTLPVGVFILDTAGQIVECNPAARQIRSGGQQATVDQHVMHQGRRMQTGEPTSLDNWAGSRAIQRGETSLDEVIDIECADGTRKTILNSELPIRDRDGAITGAVVLNQDITARRRAEAERERLINRLEATLSKVRTLEGLLPICSHCKRIRDAAGHWTRIEAYLSARTEAEFSHGICPECVARHYPEVSGLP